MTRLPQVSAARDLTSNGYRDVLRAPRHRIVLGICVSIDGISQDRCCAGAGIWSVNHHLIAKPVQNLP
jgi:hypothetical protein